MPGHEYILETLFLIFAGAAIFATIALYTRQSLVVAYILLGILVGPYGFQLISQPELVTHVSDVGIIFLLFLVGLNLHPQNLIHMFRKTFVITLISSMIFWVVTFGICLGFQMNILESVLIGICMTFSSTIIGLKLLPTTVLHHQRMGEFIISILLLQDLVAIFVMLLIGSEYNTESITQFAKLVAAVPLFLAICFFVYRYVLTPLIARFDRIQEYIFLVAVGWCLGMAQLAQSMGLTYEIGAFIAGVSIAVGPIALFIAENLRPLRDFFLIIFFFSLGANFDIRLLSQYWVTAFILAGILLMLKPAVFDYLLRNTLKNREESWETGVRLGQVSEFSLLVGLIAFQNHYLSTQAYHLIELTAIITFVVSSYVIVMHFPTPIALDDKLRRD